MEPTKEMKGIKSKKYTKEDITQMIGKLVSNQLAREEGYGVLSAQSARVVPMMRDPQPPHLAKRSYPVREMVDSLHNLLECNLSERGREMVEDLFLSKIFREYELLDDDEEVESVEGKSKENKD